MGEMVENVRALARSVDIPLICDADTGYGEAINVQRTIREYEDAGAAALHIEDQVWPKRCGFLEGKQVIPLENMTAKLRAAIDARRDPDLVIIARTDALAPLGWEEVTRRARAYRAAGADLIFVDGIKTLEDLKNCARLLDGLPLLYNGQLLHPAEIAQYGFKVMIHIATLFAIYQRTRDAYERTRAHRHDLRRRRPGASTRDNRPAGGARSPGDQQEIRSVALAVQAAADAG